MEFENLKSAANEITMPEEMKLRYREIAANAILNN